MSQRVSSSEKFETGREQAHEDRAFAEGYEYGATEAEANWELEHQIAAPYSLESEVDSVLSEREAAHIGRERRTLARRR